MLRKNTITINARPVIVSELNMIQIRELMGVSAGPDQDALAFSMSTGMNLQGRFLPADLEKLWTAFFEVNQALFTPESGGKPSGKKPVVSVFLSQLDNHICRLIEAGHARVWEYGYSFFLTALKFNAKQTAARRV